MAASSIRDLLSDICVSDDLVTSKEVRIISGTSGYNYEFWGPPRDSSHKVVNFYPIKTQKKWLSHYSKHLKSVEINCTRYRKLKPSMCETWCKQVPPDFKFTIKASLYITHNKKLNDFREWWSEFQPCIDILGDKFCSVLFQFPPSFKLTVANVDKIKMVKAIIPPIYKCAFEFRDVNWFDTKLIESHDLSSLFKDNWTQVVNIVPEVRGKDANFGNLEGGIHIGVQNPDFMYLRFHGTLGYSKGTYDLDMLRFYESVANISSDENKTKTVCAYFNNTDTWTMLPFGKLEGTYKKGVPLEKSITPSAIYDATIFSGF